MLNDRGVSGRGIGLVILRWSPLRGSALPLGGRGSINTSNKKANKVAFKRRNNDISVKGNGRSSKWYIGSGEKKKPAIGGAKHGYILCADVRTKNMVTRQRR